METVKSIVKAVIEDNNLDPSISEWIEEGACQMLRIIETYIDDNSYTDNINPAYKVINATKLKDELYKLKYS